MFMQVINAQFSGSPKSYSYLCLHPDNPVDVKVGDRVVVINKLKDDGTASLSIATVTSLEPKLPENLDGIMPIVDIINRDNLTNVTEIYRAEVKV
jgi:hypothetical protein